jgi:F-type H+-transporting ATPase subunit a
MGNVANGAKVYFTIHTPWIDISITQSAITVLTATLILALLAFLVSRNVKKRPGKAQTLVEKLISMVYGLVSDTMGAHNTRFAPYIGTLFLSSMVCTLLGMTQILRSATADLSVTMAWALVTTGMIWFWNIKNFGFVKWLKGFTEPIVVMTPMNIVSEIAQPLSLAFRHFGNVAGGGVLTALIYNALASLSAVVFGWLPNVIAEGIPFLQVGIPAVLSIYFDLFSGFVQAFVFCLLTMVYIAGASPAPQELPEDRQVILKAREEKKLKKVKQ